MKFAKLIWVLAVLAAMMLSTACTSPAAPTPTIQLNLVDARVYPATSATIGEGQDTEITVTVTYDFRGPDTASVVAYASIHRARQSVELNGVASEFQRVALAELSPHQFSFSVRYENFILGIPRGECADYAVVSFVHERGGQTYTPIAETSQIPLNWCAK